MDREKLINLINQMRQDNIERYKNNVVTGKESIFQVAKEKQER